MSHHQMPHSPTKSPSKHQLIRHERKIVRVCAGTNSIISSSTDGEIIKWTGVDLEVAHNSSSNSETGTADSPASISASGSPAPSIVSPHPIYGVQSLKIDTNEGFVVNAPTSGGANFTSTTLTSIHVSEDEKYVFTASMQHLRVFSLLTGESIRTFKTPQGLLSVTVDTDRGLVFAGGLNGRIFAWDYMNGLTFQPFKNFEFSRKTTMNGGGANPEAQDTSTDQKRHHSRSIHHLAIYNDYLISCGDDHFIRQWDTYNGSMLSQYSSGLDSPVTRFEIAPASASPWYRNVLLSHYNPASSLSSPLNFEPKDIAIVFLQHHHAVSCVACVPREDQDASPHLIIFGNVIELMTFDHMTAFAVVRHKMIALFNRITSRVEIYNFNKEMLFAQSIPGGVFTHNLMEFQGGPTQSLHLVYVRNQRVEDISCEWKKLRASKSDDTAIVNYTRKHQNLVYTLCDMGYDRTCVQQCVQMTCESATLSQRTRDQDPDTDVLMDQCIEMLQRDFSSEDTTHLQSYLQQHNVEDAVHIEVPPQRESLDFAAIEVIEQVNGNYAHNGHTATAEVLTLRARLDKLKENKTPVPKKDSVTIQFADDTLFEQVCAFYVADNDEVLDRFYSESWNFSLHTRSGELRELQLQELMELFIPQLRSNLFKPQRDSYPHYFQKPHAKNIPFYESAGRCIAHCLLHNIQLPSFEVSEIVFKVLCNDLLQFSDLQYTFPDIFRLLCRLITSSKEPGMNPMERMSLHFFDTGTQQELKPNGRNLCVDMSNLGEYISLYSKHRLYGHVKESVDAFLTGFHSLIPRQLCAGVASENLQFVLCGQAPEVHTHVLKKQVVYGNVYTMIREKSHIVQWFWKIFETMLTKEERCVLYEQWSGERLRRAYEARNGAALMICGNPLSEMDVTFSMCREEHCVEISPDFEDLDELLRAIQTFVSKVRSEATKVE